MSLCEKCQSKGLPIYPVRYAVAPDYVTASLPTWAEKKQLPNLSKQSKYVLRTMRKGYLYVLSQYDNDELNLVVEVYAVDEQGGFWWQDISKELDLLQYSCQIASKEQLIPLSDTKTSCNNIAHSSSNIAFITIDKPETCDTVWLAFSEHKWSYETLTQYLYDKDKRNTRMQMVKPQQWLSAQMSQDGITIASEDTIATTMDMLCLDEAINSSNSAFGYKQPISASNYYFSYPYLYALAPLKEEPISKSVLMKEPFKYNKSLFTKRSTLTKWPFIPSDIQNQGLIRTEYSAYLAQKMNSINRNSSGCPPMMVALVDSIGIAAELSSWGNNAINAVKTVITERQRENAAFSGIQLLEETIKNSDLADNEEKFKEDLRRKNDAYLSDARSYNSDSYLDKWLVTAAENNNITPWNEAQKAQGKRVVDIMAKAENQWRSSHYRDQYHYDPDNYRFISPVPEFHNPSAGRVAIADLQRSAAFVLEKINNNYPIEGIGEDQYSSTFIHIFQHDNEYDMAETTKLRAELSKIEVDFETKFPQYKQQWHLKNKTQQSGEQRWRKYQACLNKDYETYKKEYAIFLDDTDNYVSGLLDDLIVWVNCFSQKSQHPFSLAADDLERDSGDYLAFANDILMTLGMQADSDKVEQFFTKLVEDSDLDGHNLVWSSVLADRKLDKGAQRKCVSFLLTLNKNSFPADMSYGQLLNKLKTVINFYEGSSFENNAVINLTASINGISDSVFAEPESNKGFDSAKELISLLDSERGAIGSDNSPQAQITAAYIKPIKEASAAALLPLLKYLHHVGGNVSSEFAQAWFVAATPGRLSKEALNQLMTSYAGFTNRLKQAMLKNTETMGNKLAAGYQKLAEVSRNTLSGRTVGGALVGGMLVYQVFTIYTLLSDRTLKTNLQQTKANLQLSVAAAASLSLSFRLAAVYGENGHLGQAVLGNVKFLGSFFGFISGLTKSASIFVGDKTERSGVEKTLFWLSSGAEMIATVDLFFQLGKTSLVEFLEKRFALIGVVFVGAASKAAVTLVLERVLMLIVLVALNPWVNLGLFFIQLVIELNKEDDMQIWLRRCRFGKAQLGTDNDYSDRYQSSEQEVKELKAIFAKLQQQLTEYYQEQEDKRQQKLYKEANSMWSASGWREFNNMRF